MFFVSLTLPIEEENNQHKVQQTNVNMKFNKQFCIEPRPS